MRLGFALTPRHTSRKNGLVFQALVALVALSFTFQIVAGDAMASADSHGAAVHSVNAQSTPDPVIALVLGILIPGAGHIYAGETGTGIMILSLVFLNCLLAVGAYFFCAIVLGGCFSGCIANLVGLVSAFAHLGLMGWGGYGGYQAAQRAAEAAESDEWSFLPGNSAPVSATALALP